MFCSQVSLREKGGGGFFASLNLPFIGRVGAGFHYAPLTHFAYDYFEEVRAPMSGIYEDAWRNDEIPPVKKVS